VVGRRPGGVAALLALHRARASAAAPRCRCRVAGAPHRARGSAAGVLRWPEARAAPCPPLSVATVAPWRRTRALSSRANPGALQRPGLPRNRGARSCALPPGRSVGRSGPRASSSRSLGAVEATRATAAEARTRGAHQRRGGGPGHGGSRASGPWRPPGHGSRSSGAVQAPGRGSRASGPRRHQGAVEAPGHGGSRASGPWSASAARWRHQGAVKAPGRGSRASGPWRPPGHGSRASGTGGSHGASAGAPRPLPLKSGCRPDPRSRVVLPPASPACYLGFIRPSIPTI
jgi:hypothetical protein